MDSSTSCVSLRSFTAACGTSCMVMTISGSVTTSFPPPCDPWQRRVLSAPFYAQPITPFYTITYISPLHLSFSSFATTLCDSESGLVSWQPSPIMCPPPIPHNFHEPYPTEGLQSSSFSYLTNFLQTGWGTKVETLYICLLISAIDFIRNTMESE